MKYPYDVVLSSCVPKLRNAKSYPILEAIARLDRHSVLCEHRPVPMQWAHLDSKG
jgi:hypothetical protein